MCLVVVALGAAPGHPLVIAANRDEQHARATEQAAWWPDRAGIFAGRDLVAGGTWLGADRAGRFAAVTNVRDGPPKPGPRSRGALVADYLGAGPPAEAYLQRVAAEAGAYGAFNLLIVEGSALRYASNRAPATALGIGVHAFSNAPFGADWPKIASAQAGMVRALEKPDPTEALFGMLAERAPAGTADAYSSAHFLVGPVYGTRCSTVVVVDAAGRVTFAERSFDARGEPTGEVREAFTLPGGARV